jgi:hypothetical protein
MVSAFLEGRKIEVEAPPANIASPIHICLPPGRSIVDLARASSGLVAGSAFGAGGKFGEVDIETETGSEDLIAATSGSETFECILYFF